MGKGGGERRNWPLETGVTDKKREPGWWWWGRDRDAERKKGT